VSKLIDFNECLEKGLLRRLPASKTKALQSIGKAKELLLEAKADFNDGRFNSTVIVAYMALFHAARSLLFKDGFREKSHECIIRFLEEKYVKTKKIPLDFVELLDKFKAERTHTQYDVTYSPSEEEAEKIINFTGKFIELIEEMV